MKTQYTCDQCGIEFSRYANPNATWHFCGRECLRKARLLNGVIGKSRHKEFERICLSCSKSFLLLKKSKKQFCNRACANAARKVGGVIALKVDETTLKNHGVKRIFQDRKRICSVMKSRYGVENASQIPGMGKANWLKAHETKRKNGTYASSMIEHAFCDALTQEHIEFETQVNVFGRPIDVKVDDVFIQIDGRYWHGLDRSIDELKKSTSARDVAIYARWKSDREQDEQFKKNGLKLLRFTDLEVKTWLKQKRSLRQIIKEALDRMM